MKTIPTTLCTLSCILIHLALPAQCTTGTQPECECETAPVLCTIDELDGYEFSMTSFQHPDDGPSPICPGANQSQTNNPTWFAFTAWCTDLTLRVAASDCVPVQGYVGFQLAIYDDCTFDNAVACNADIDDCDDDDKILNITGLDIGEVYYFVVDGCLGSYCDVSIDVIGVCGQEEIAPWTTPLLGNTMPCVGETTSYEAEDLDGAGTYHWFLNGSLADMTSDNLFTITWNTTGTYELCVDASNDPCVPITNAPAPQCTTITVHGAEAGSIQALPERACANEPVLITTTGYNAGPDNAQVILVVNVAGYIIEVIPSTTGTFVTGIAGAYTIYSYNYIPGNTSIPDIGSHILELNCTLSCCDLESMVITVQDLSATAYAAECHDNGTGDDPGDDVFYFTLLVTGAGPGVAWSTADGSMAGLYGQEQIVGPFPISGGNPGMVIQDNETPQCLTSVFITPPLPCSSCGQSVDAGNGFVLNCLDSTGMLGASASEVGDFHWTGPGSFSAAGISTAVIDSGWYVVTVDFPNSCSFTDSVYVGMDRLLPIANAGPDQSLDCTGNAVMLDGSLSTGDNLAFAWKDAGGQLISNQPFITTGAAGAYTLEVKNEINGCVAADTVSVLSNPDAITSVLADVFPESCIDDSNGEILVNSVNGGTPPYQFSLDELNTNTHGIFTGLAPGMYQMQISDALGCLVDTAFLVGAGAYLTISLPPLIELTEGQSGQVIATVNVPLNQLAGVQWIPPGILACDTCLVTTLPLSVNEHFQLTATHINGCIAVAELDIVVVPGPQVFIPNAFSPNRDGINDYFTLFANDRVEKITRMDIFDRWGEHIFHRHDFAPNDPVAGWDGTFHNRLLHPGAYVYVLEMLMRDGSSQMRKGDITLLR